MKLTLTEIHLWLAFPNEVTSASLLADYRRMLSEQERVRMDRFRFQRDRHTFLVSRAMVRTVLSRYARVDPAAWRFGANAYGKPEIAAPETEMPLVFNLSHTDGLILFAVSLENSIGVDTENTGRSVSGQSLARRYFSPGEFRDLQARPDHWTDRFYEYWTLKESFIKAKGMGLSIPLDSFGFGMPGDHGLTITFEPDTGDNPDHWHFRLMQPTDRHKASLAYFAPCGRKKDVVAYKIVPLEQQSPAQCAVLRETAL